ncbi:hypothetical protein [Providencia rettgeri]|uniref:hypothetical protein n=1 Tax=Providencia rettgeri TaxID=587 RepID=UPI00301036F4
MKEKLAKSNSLKNKIISLLFLLSCFCIPNFMGIYWGEIFALFLLSIIFLKGNTFLLKETLIFAIGYVVLLILIAVNLWATYYHNTFASFYYFFRAARYLFWFLLLALITNNFLKFNLSFILQIIIPFVFIFHAVIIFLVYFDFFELREPIMAISNASPIIYTQIFRSSGMWGGFDSASTFMAIGIVYFMAIFNKSAILKYTYILILFLALFLTAARIGSILLAIIFIVFISHRFLKLQLLTIFKYFIAFIILIVTLLFLYMISEEYQILPSQFTYTINRMLEVVNNGGTTTSTDALLTMYYLPNDEITLLIGNSLNSFYNEQSVKSDVEYIKFAWGIGLPLTIILFSYVIIGMLYLINKYNENKKLYYFFIILLIMIAISAFKGEYFFAYRISTFYILIFWLSIYSLPSNNSQTGNFN